MIIRIIHPLWAWLLAGYKWVFVSWIHYWRWDLRRVL
jgi:hypothetical protein